MPMMILTWPAGVFGSASEIMRFHGRVTDAVKARRHASVEQHEERARVTEDGQPRTVTWWALTFRAATEEALADIELEVTMLAKTKPARLLLAADVAARDQPTEDR